jgi:hypothetical protein
MLVVAEAHARASGHSAGRGVIGGPTTSYIAGSREVLTRPGPHRASHVVPGTKHRTWHQAPHLARGTQHQARVRLFVVNPELATQQPLHLVRVKSLSKKPSLQTPDGLWIGRRLGTAQLARECAGEHLIFADLAERGADRVPRGFLAHAQRSHLTKHARPAMTVDGNVVSRARGGRSRVVQRARLPERGQCGLDDVVREALAAQPVRKLPRRQLAPAKHEQAGRDRRARRQL